MLMGEMERVERVSGREDARRVLVTTGCKWSVFEKIRVERVGDERGRMTWRARGVCWREDARAVFGG